MDTRLRKLEAGEYDAIILAAAGLNRLGKTELVKQIIPAEVMCPAAGQGALGIEIRAGDSVDAAASRVPGRCRGTRHHHLRARTAEQTGWRLPGSNRRLRRSMRWTDCSSTPIVAHPDGSKVLRESRQGTDPVQLGESVGEALLRRGGDAILEAVYGQGIAVPQQP